MQQEKRSGGGECANFNGRFFVRVLLTFRQRLRCHGMGSYEDTRRRDIVTYRKDGVFSITVSTYYDFHDIKKDQYIEKQVDLFDSIKTMKCIPSTETRFTR